MDRNSIIGITLIFALFFVWQYLTRPSAEQIEAQKRLQDSIQQVEARVADSIAAANAESTNTPIASLDQDGPADTFSDERLQDAFGPFAPAGTGTETERVLENEFIKITFTSKGGRIKEALLKDYFKIEKDENRKDIKVPLYLMNNEENQFNYFFPIAGLPTGGVNSSDLFFAPSTDGDALVFRASAGEGRYFEQRYTLDPDSYHMQYNVRLVGLNSVLAATADAIELEWINFLDKIEKNDRVERTYATTYFKKPDDRARHCAKTGNDTKSLDGESLKWVSNSNQFFNSTLIADETFMGGEMSTANMEDTDEELKKLTTTLRIPYTRESDESFGMTYYIGPNKFERLRDLGSNVEDIVPFGWNIFGTINRWIIRPIFGFLSGIFGGKGWVILALTLLVKLALYPLTYRMLYSQSKMSALKPEMEKVRAKNKDDQQQAQMETMKLYREFGVNPLGSCLPLLLQMPIWFALYRFFPASIEFRQEGFWWANDLSSYDEFFQLPFTVPLGIGSHISLFTVLWAVTTLIYTYYNSRHMDMNANPAMKYMQYIMPLFFLGFFNSYASGLTAYLLFSNVTNILQTLVTKNYIIDQAKIKREMDDYRKKPKKKSNFRKRLEEAVEEQRKLQEQQKKKKKK
ncbi:MAG: membrane protein insertase YidC [Saprospiraceae bacterium]|nr:membrane protein insertase YidC [Saprospiraceae bacterium]